MVEIWKDLENYIGIYQISNTGKVKSLARPVIIKDKIINLKERLLKNDINKKGYCRVTLSKNSKINRYLVHRLVANTFIDNPLNKPFVNHIDNNPSNNRSDNLEFVIHSENMVHSQKQNRLFKSQSKGGVIAGIKQIDNMFKNLQDSVGKTYGCFRILSITNERSKNNKLLLLIICNICGSTQKQNLSYLKLRSPKKCKFCKTKIQSGLYRNIKLY